MKTLSWFLALMSVVTLGAQNKSLLGALQPGDSLVIYQCHVEKASASIQTASGQTLSGQESLSSVTEKFVILKTEAGYQASYYTSDMSILPNRKFSGLKIREKDYWHFNYVGTKSLDAASWISLLVLEKSGREAMEYDYMISKHTRNQIIFKHHKNFKQQVYEPGASVYLVLGFNVSN